MSVCTASAAFNPTICPGYTPCNPNAIQLGDDVTIQLCMENGSEMPSAAMPPYPRVMAALAATAQVEIFLMCAESVCSSPQLSDPLSLTYESFTPAPNVSSAFTLGPTTNCLDPLACGLLTLSSDVMLPAGGTVCLGTLTHLETSTSSVVNLSIY